MLFATYVVANILKFWKSSSNSQGQWFMCQLWIVQMRFEKKVTLLSGLVNRPVNNLCDSCPDRRGRLWHYCLYISKVSALFFAPSDVLHVMFDFVH